MKDISTKTESKIVLSLIWIAIPILFIAAIMLFFMIINKPNILPSQMLLLSIMISFILVFAGLLIRGITKYQKELVMNDTEKRRNWKHLSNDFKSFYRKLEIFQLLMAIFMIILGIYEVFHPKTPNDYIGFFVLFMGIMLLFTFRKNRRKR